MNYYIEPFKNIFNFSGKSSRKEFWYFFLINILISILIGVIKSIIGVYNLGYYYELLILIPFISLGFRRLKDAGISSWLFIFPVLNLVLATFPSKTKK